MLENRLSIFNKIYNISKDTQDKITLWMNHLLVVYAFLIPVHNKAKSSVFFCILVLFLYRRDFIYYLRIAFKNELLKYFLLLYLLFVIGMLYSSDLESGFSFMDKAKFLIYPLIFLSFLDTRFSFRILNAFIFGVLLSEIVSYLIHFQIIPPELFIREYKIYESILEDPSPFFTHGTHNMFLCLVITILIYRLLIKDIKDIKFKILSLVFITTAFINISLIGGRVGYLVLFCLIFVVVFLIYKKEIKKGIFIIFSILFIMSTYLYNFSEQFDKRIQDGRNDLEKIITEKNYNSSIGLRIITSYYVLEIIKDNFLIGVGTGDVMQKVNELANEKYSYIENISHPHNLYLQVLAQLGIIGFSIMLLVFYKILAYESGDKKRSDIVKIITITLLIYALTASFWTHLAIFVTIVSAMISHQRFSFEIKEINNKSILRYAFLIIIFLIIGITK